MRRDILLSVGLAGALCVDVRIGDAGYLDCLNQMFRAATKPAAGSELSANPAAIPAPASGLYTQSAIREILGASFGHSVIPSRPAQPVFQRFPR
jgi:hypothetical protein